MRTVLLRWCLHTFHKVHVPVLLLPSKFIQNDDDCDASSDGVSDTGKVEGIVTLMAMVHIYDDDGGGGRGR